VDNESQQGVSRATGGVANPEVEPKAKRRRFTAEYKARILAEVDSSSGQMGAILRREGLYSSHLSNWRKAARAATVKALSKKRGRKGKSEAEREVERLRRDKARLEHELYKARVIIDGQKKLAEVLGVTLPTLAELGLPPEDESE
jgi:transposase-like protein